MLRKRHPRPVGKVFGADDLGAIFPGWSPVGILAVVGVARVFGVGGRGGAGVEALVVVGREAFAGFEGDVGSDEGLGV